MRGWNKLCEEGGGGRGPAPRLPPARRASPPSGPAAGPPVLAREGARRVGRGAAGIPRRRLGGGIRAHFWKQRSRVRCCRSAASRFSPILTTAFSPFYQK